MAGTGHAYEIANPDEVDTAISQLVAAANARNLPPAAKWVGSRAFRRYLTGRRFTYPIKIGHAAVEAMRGDGAGIMFRKLSEGAEVRRYSPELFHADGPDLIHILDWALHLKSSGSSDYPKLARMDTAVIAAKANAWTATLGRKTTEEGSMQIVLAVSEDLAWYDLLDGAALEYEGARMSHCIGGMHYRDALERGEKRILSLRRNRSKPILTLEIITPTTNPTLVQIQGNANSGLPTGLGRYVISLFNEIGLPSENRAASGYNIAHDGTRWVSVFDLWETVDVFGATMLTDGKTLLLRAATAPDQALLSISNLAGARDWFRGVIDTNQIYVKLTDPRPPHYDDQKLACEVLNAMGRDIPHLRYDWAATDAEGLLLPRVDLFETAETGGVFHYVTKDQRDGGDAVLLPHSEDRARILVALTKRSWKTDFQVQTGQRVGRSQLGRCFALMDAYEINSPGNYQSDTAETKAFRETYDPIRSPGGWRSFALDKKTEPAKHGKGTWETTDYHLRLRGEGISSTVRVDLDGRRAVSVDAFTMDRTVAAEIADRLNRLAVNEGVSTHHSEASRFSGNPRMLLYRHDGRWSWMDTAAKVARTGGAILAAFERRPSAADPRLADQIARMARTHSAAGRSKSAMDDIYRRAVAVWFLSETDFSRYQAVPEYGRSIERAAENASLAERLVALHDAGYRAGTAKEVARIRKCVREMFSRLAYRSTLLMDDWIADVILRWHMHLDKPTLNRLPSTVSPKAAWFDVKGRERDIAALLGGGRMYGTKFHRSLVNLAEKAFRQDMPAAIGQEAFRDRVMLWEAFRRSGGFLYSWHLEAFDSIVGTYAALASAGSFDPDERAEIDRVIELVGRKIGRENVLPAATAA